MFTAKLHSPDSSVLKPEAPHTDPGKTTDWMPVKYQVTDRWVENKTMVTYGYKPAGDQKLEPIRPGQFNMLYAFGVGEIPISVSSVSQGDEKIIHTIQDVGAVSHALCQMNIGDEIGVRGPFGSAWPMESAYDKDIIIMAGGVGFAPLRPVIELVACNRNKYGNVNFLFGTRNPDNIFFHRDIISLQSDPAINFLVTVDHSFNNWYGNVGVVTSLIQKAVFDPKNAVGFVCGPEIMMRYGAYALMEAGIDEQQIYLSMERNMKCALGQCGRCQYGPFFICKDGPVFPFSTLKDLLKISEL